MTNLEAPSVYATETPYIPTRRPTVVPGPARRSSGPQQDRAGPSAGDADC